MIGRQCCQENLLLYTVTWTEQGRKKCIGVDLKRIVSYWQCWLLLPAPGVWTDSVDPNFSPCVFLQREQERETWQIVFRQKKVQNLTYTTLQEKDFLVLIRKASSCIFSSWILQSQKMTCSELCKGLCLNFKNSPHLGGSKIFKTKIYGICIWHLGRAILACH